MASIEADAKQARRARWRAGCQNIADSLASRIRAPAPGLASTPMTATRQRTRAGPPRSSSPPAWPPPAGRSSSATPAPASASSTSSPSTARTLVFVEVKAGREGSAFGPERPILAVGPRKQRQVRRLATAWMAERRGRPRYDEIRFDAVGVTFDRAGRVATYEHIEGAF